MPNEPKADWNAKAAELLDALDHSVGWCLADAIAAALRSAHASGAREAAASTYEGAAAFVEHAKPPMTNNATAVVRKNFTLIADEFRERAAKLRDASRVGGKETK